MKPLFHALFITLALFAALPSKASAQQIVGQAPCGVPILVAGANPQGATATVWNGTRIIWIDAMLLQQGGPLASFTIQHECGHHMLGHVSWEGMIARQWATAQQELEADCYAARLSGSWISEAVARHFEFTQGTSSPAPGYPNGVTRAVNIRQCAAASGGRTF